MNDPKIEPHVVTDDNFRRAACSGAGGSDCLRARRDCRADHIRSRATIPPPPPYDAKRIQAVRRKLNLNQRDFASALNVSDKTVKAWEQGVKPPGSSALRLLEIIERHPEVIPIETAD